MTVLVTGGAGYIGSHAVKDLLRAGRSVVVLDDLSAGNARMVPSAVTLYRGDFSDVELLDRIFAENDIDAVVHFAAFKDAAESVSEPLKYYDNNVARSIRLLEFLADRGVEKFVFSSTAAVYGDVDGYPIDEGFATEPVNPYGWSKLMFEQILADTEAQSGLRSVSLRYFNAAGADPDGELGNTASVRKDVVSALISAAVSGSTFTINGADYDTADGTPVRDLVHVSDLASAHTLALDYLDRGGETFVANLGSGRGFTIRELAAVTAEVTGSSFPVVVGPRREGDIAVSVASSELVFEKLGWVPVHSDVESIIGSSWAWERAYHTKG